MNGKCRLTGEDLIPIIDIGEQYVNDFVDKEDITNRDRVHLKVGIGPSSGLVQLFDSYSPDKMYKQGTYWYSSSINEAMKAELKDIALSAQKYVSLKPGDIALDIASNSGELLTNYSKDIYRVGIDPCSVARDSDIYTKEGIHLINTYFSKEAYFDKISDKAKIISVIAMFYDLEDPRKFLQDVRETIREDGVLIIQMSYMPLMLEQNEIGNISEEHLCYYTLEVLKNLLVETGFALIDCQLNDTNGGSFRVYAMPDASLCKLPLHTRSVADMRIASILAYEASCDFTNPNSLHYTLFSERIEQNAEDLRNFLIKAKEEGKLVCGLGASTKGNTVLQYSKITPDLLPFIGERSPAKFGKYTVGTGIPIISEEEMRAKKPDYLIVFPWHFITGMIEREKELIESGTELVVPLPRLKVY